MASRPATIDDVDRVTETITLAFLHDPVWSVALARPDGSTAHHAAYWRLYVKGSLRYSTLYVAGEAAAVSVWIPPGGTEVSEAQAVDLQRLIEEALNPPAARAMFELWDRFASNHPHEEPHAYLSLLATHPDHRGHGVGQRLLAEDLARWDAAGIPTYLESTNPWNDHRHERADFRRIGGFTAVLDGAPVTTMWRPVGGLSDG